MTNFSMEQLGTMSTDEIPETFHVDDGVYKVRVSNVYSKNVNIQRGDSPGLCALITIRHQVLNKKDSDDDMKLARPVVAEFWGRDVDLAKDYGSDGGSVRQYLREVLNVENVDIRLGLEAILGKEFVVMTRFKAKTETRDARSSVRRIIHE